MYATYPKALERWPFPVDALDRLLGDPEARPHVLSNPLLTDRQRIAQAEAGCRARDTVRMMETASTDGDFVRWVALNEKRTPPLAALAKRSIPSDLASVIAEKATAVSLQTALVRRWDIPVSQKIGWVQSMAPQQRLQLGVEMLTHDHDTIADLEDLLVELLREGGWKGSKSNKNRVQTVVDTYPHRVLEMLSGDSADVRRAIVYSHRFAGNDEVQLRALAGCSDPVWKWLWRAMLYRPWATTAALRLVAEYAAAANETWMVHQAEQRIGEDRLDTPDVHMIDDVRQRSLLKRETDETVLPSGGVIPPNLSLVADLAVNPTLFEDEAERLLRIARDYLESMCDQVGRFRTQQAVESLLRIEECSVATPVKIDEYLERLLSEVDAWSRWIGGGNAHEATTGAGEEVVVWPFDDALEWSVTRLTVLSSRAWGGMGEAIRQQIGDDAPAWLSLLELMESKRDVSMGKLVKVARQLAVR